MAELTSGALVRFLQEMNIGGNSLADDKPVLLQIRSIIPVLREGDLWPNQGFFLRVSDLSHAIYVSLPQEQDDMVLCDKLHIGQLLFVEKLEAAYPVPLLKGIRTLPGRYPCNGSPKDLIPMQSLEKFLGVSKLDSINDEKKNPIEKPQPLSNSKGKLIEGTGRIGSMSCVFEDNNHMFKEKQREKSLYLSPSGVSSNETSSDEKTVRTESPSMKKEENDKIMEKQIENSHSATASKGSSSDGTRKTTEKSCKVEESRSNEQTKKKQTEKSKSNAWNSSRGSMNERLGRRGSIYKPRQSDVESNLSYKPKRSEAESYHKAIRRQKPRYPRDSDMESTISSASTSLMVKRRSWTVKEAKRVEDFLGTAVLKHEVKPDSSYPSIPISPVRLYRSDSSDDNASSITKCTVTSITTKSSKTPSKSTKLESLVHYFLLLLYVKVFCVNALQKVQKQREIALLAAVEALLEASAAEKLLKCLSIYSEIHSVKKEEQHPSVDKFFNLQDDLVQAKLISQSTTNTFPLRRSNSDPIASFSDGEESKLAFDRKLNAITWIKSALESDLNPVSDNIKATNISMESTSTPKISTKTSPGNLRGGTLLFKKQTSKTEMLDLENQQDWVKGSALSASSELASCLNKECRTWFLSYVEDYLDLVSTKTSSIQSDSQQTAEIMYQVKKVSDWLDMRCKENSNMEDSELEACGRVRSKIYGILLKHVERTSIYARAES
ncbi:uncharacterized protein LOC110624215 [Manihot esculenta]|uniref:uncharacterized protein LOC110624215 n=1 Tax=Manihot esculenta TaxID=3983 RepID=UPI001CC3AFC0|nr:uncharacterized protein LOC110624215 [Manihot esculenta]